VKRCNPIAETDLAEFMLNCVEDTSKWNQILNIGGPDDGMTMKQQGEMIFKVTYRKFILPWEFLIFYAIQYHYHKILNKEPKFWTAPVSLFDFIISLFDFFGKMSKKAEDAAELARIGKYYAVEDMLTTQPIVK
jgi:divinyl chlorophyllide a 8-vinyl-reductase